MSFASFRTHVFGVKTLQLPVYLSKLILNLSLKGFKSARVGLATDGPSFQKKRFFAKDSLKLNKIRNTCLISLNIILYY